MGKWSVISGKCLPHQIFQERTFNVMKKLYQGFESKKLSHCTFLQNTKSWLSLLANRSFLDINSLLDPQRFIVVDSEEYCEVWMIGV